MTVEIKARNVPQAYVEALWQMRIHGERQISERGEVLRIPGISILEITHPKERVLFDPIRNANPFFHVMEFVWMMSGSNDPVWLGQFNKNILKSADYDSYIHGAYGRRWERGNQIYKLVQLLKKAPNTRRAVLSMWDGSIDLTPGHNDYPCNTHIYFDYDGDKLNMTVCNRSNDLIWGMLGANAVHMTMLLEVICAETKMDIGSYRVVTNNLHMYTSLDKFEQILATSVDVDRYPLTHEPILGNGETSHHFQVDCRKFMLGRFDTVRNTWLLSTAVPIYKAYMERKKNPITGMGLLETNQIAAPDWRIACKEWIERKTS